MGLTGLQKAVTGERVGSRVLAVLPPKYGYGTQGNSQIGVKPTDTLVWVVDVLHAFPPGVSASGQHVSNGGGACRPCRPGRAASRRSQVPEVGAAGQAGRQDADQGHRRADQGRAVDRGQVSAGARGEPAR